MLIFRGVTFQAMYTLPIVNAPFYQSICDANGSICDFSMEWLLQRICIFIDGILGGGNSNIFYFHPQNWGR